MGKRKPINPAGREGDFFKLNDIQFEIKASREYLNQDIPSKVWLYRIDIIKTKNDDIYGETRSSEKVTHPPVELDVKMTIEDSETIFLGEGGISREIPGDLTFTVYNDELEEKKVDIRRGDFCGVVDTNGKMRFFEIIKNNKMNISNKKSLGGIKSFYREVTAKFVQADVFNG